MKVWINRAKGRDIGGLAIVAARSAKEAHRKLVAEDESYWDWYRSEDWEEAPMLTANTDKPCFIAEESYQGW